MASIEKRQRTADGKITWRAMYRTPEGQQRSKTFDRKIEAQRFLTTVESDKLGGSYVDPARSVGTVGELATTWLAGKVNLKPSTAERYASIIREHIEPRWGTVRLVDVAHSASAVLGRGVDRNPVTVDGAEGTRRAVADPRLGGA